MGISPTYISSAELAHPFHFRFYHFIFIYAMFSQNILFISSFFFTFSYSK